MKEIFTRWKNKIRIWFLERFTNRIQRHVIKDPETGKEHNVVSEKTIEKVCDHKTITEIAPTMWKCTGCDEVYFQIGYKVMLTPQDLVGYLGQIADHLKITLKDSTEDND